MQTGIPARHVNCRKLFRRPNESNEQPEKPKGLFRVWFGDSLTLADPGASPSPSARLLQHDPGLVSSQDLSILLGKTGCAGWKGCCEDFLRWHVQQLGTQQKHWNASSSSHRTEVRGPETPTGSVRNHLSYHAPSTQGAQPPCGLQHVHQADRMGLGKLIIQQTRPSQIPSKGMV